MIVTLLQHMQGGILLIAFLVFLISDGEDWDTSTRVASVNINCSTKVYSKLEDFR